MNALTHLRRLQLEVARLINENEHMIERIQELENEVASLKVQVEYLSLPVMLPFNSGKTETLESMTSVPESDLKSPAIQDRPFDGTYLQRSTHIRIVHGGIPNIAHGLPTPDESDAKQD